VAEDKKRREELHIYCLEYVLKNQDLKKNYRSISLRKNKEKRTWRKQNIA
jgi:hypothetical protein